MGVSVSAAATTPPGATVTTASLASGGTLGSPSPAARPVGVSGVQEAGGGIQEWCLKEEARPLHPTSEGGSTEAQVPPSLALLPT